MSGTRAAGIWLVGFLELLDAPGSLGATLRAARSLQQERPHGAVSRTGIARRIDAITEMPLRSLNRSEFNIVEFRFKLCETSRICIEFAVVDYR